MCYKAANNKIGERFSKPKRLLFELLLPKYKVTFTYKRITYYTNKVNSSKHPTIILTCFDKLSTAPT